jgi:hypothetical protein
MSTRSLLRCAAGMKNVCARFRRETSQIQFLESSRRHGGNLRPMVDRIRKHISRLAKFSIRRIVLELQREENECHAVEFGVVVCTQREFKPRAVPHLAGRNSKRRNSKRRFLRADGNKLAQSRGKDRQVRRHAVFNLTGWFSATAEERILNGKFRTRKDDETETVEKLNEVSKDKRLGKSPRLFQESA